VPQQPGDEGARHRVRLRLLVAQRLCRPLDPQRQLQNHLPAYTGGRLRANGPGEGRVEGIDDLVASDAPPETLQRFPNAWPEGLAFGSSKKPMSQRPWGRLEPTPSVP
jgi:hypothetical protein